MMQANNISRLLLSLVTSCLLTLTALAQPGSNDATFNVADSITFGANAVAHAIAFQADGKTVLGGAFINYNEKPYNRIVRLNINGSIDASFTPGTGFDAAVYAITIQPDGKMLVGGDFANFNGVPINRIARLNADGTLDNSFNPGAGFGNHLSAAFPDVKSILLQPDGKILVGGDFTSFNGTTINHIARLNTDGTLDNSFNPGTGFNNPVGSMALQSDGKLLVGGTFISFNGTTANRIVRLEADGSLDNTFTPGTGFTSPDQFLTTINGIVIQPDGKMVTAGRFKSFNGTARENIARLNADGTLDNSFNPGTGFTATVTAGVNSMVLQSDGKIIAVGDFTTYNGTTVNRIARLNTDGTLDNAYIFGTGALAGLNGEASTVALQSDGRAVVSGVFLTYNGIFRQRVIRLNTNGVPDNTFHPFTGFDAAVSAIAVQPDGKMVVGGVFPVANDTIRNRIVRLNADGTNDASFSAATGRGFNDVVTSVVLQPDGKILVGGAFTSFNGENFISGTNRASRIVRLHTDGTLDNTFFTPGFGVNDRINSIALQSDGAMVLGGNFTAFNGTTGFNRILRINADGSRDNTFNPGTGFGGNVLAITLQPDGKILVGGLFTSYNGTTGINRIARLNADGSLDASFATGTGFGGNVTSMVVQPDGKILVGGLFTSYNGTTGINRIARLNADGSLDNAFTTATGTGFIGDVNSIVIQPDNKLVVAGNFTDFNGTALNRIARLNADGSLDNTFLPGTGFGGVVNRVVLQADGKILAGGNFVSFSGVQRRRIARLAGYLGGTLSVDFKNIRAFRLGSGIQLEWNTENETDIVQFSVERSADGRNFTTQTNVSARNSQLSERYHWLDVQPGSGDNFYRIKGVTLQGRALYSGIVRVRPESNNTGISLYPNPAVKGQMLSMDLHHVAKGTYRLSLYNAAGVMVLHRVMEHGGGAAVQSFPLPAELAAGSYLLVVLDAAGKASNYRINIQ